MMLVIIAKVIETAKYKHKERMYTGQVAVIDDNFVVSRYTSRAGEMIFVTEGVINIEPPKNVKEGGKVFYNKDTDKFTDSQGVLVGQVKRITQTKHFAVVHFGAVEQCTVQREKVSKNKKDSTQTPVKKSKEKDV